MSLAQVLEEGRLIRHKWSDEQDGRQLLCLYTALVGDPDARPGSCPASLAPKWLAHLLPWIDDAGTEAAWPGVVRRVAAIAPRFGELQGERATRLDYRVRALCVREAMRHTTDAAALSACETVAMLCERAGRGEAVIAKEWRAAARAADAAAYAAAYADDAADDAAYAAAAAADAASYAAAAAAADAASYAATATAADAADADRLIDGILAELEKELAS